MVKGSFFRYCATAFSIILFPIMMIGCGSYVAVTDYSLETIPESYITADFSETDWEGYTDRWSEDASDVFFVTTVNGNVVDANVSTGQMGKAEWGYYTVNTEPPVSIQWSDKKRFKEYKPHHDLYLYLITPQETIKISKDMHQEILARLESGKPIMVNYLWNKVKTEDPQE